MLEAQHISMSRGGKTLLADASCMIGRSEKVGIVGANGAGKTTFLRVLRGELEPDAGVVFRPKRIGYLGQERLADALLTGADDGADPASVTVREVMLSGRDLARLADELRRLEAALATTTGDELDAVLARYGDAEERFQRLGGYDAEHEIGALLEGLGLAEVALEQPIATLSGGQKTRLALARTLFTTHDLLLLDEPTNHLDGPAIVWLMEYLARYEGAVIIVSHDLELLDRAISRILHLDSATRTLTAYTGNYTSYQRQRMQNEARAVAQTERLQTKITQLEDQANWMRGKTAKMARRAKVMDHRIERLRDEAPDVSALPRRERVFHAALPVARQSGRLVFTVEQLAKSYDEKQVFSNLSFELERGKRLAVIGRNGAGKTTLLRILAGLTPPTGGRIITGPMVDVGYYAQEHESLHMQMTLLEELRLAATESEHLADKVPNDGALRSLLGRFMFSGPQAFQKVGSLSGGEKTRLALAKLMLGGYNTLLLDEPTNNLDPHARDQVCATLAAYQGTLIVVSHDVQFVETLSPDLALPLATGAVRYFEPAHLKQVAKV